MKARASLKMRGSKITSIRVGPKWTTIQIRVRTDSIAAQGTRRIFGGQAGIQLRRKIRSESHRRQAP
jgi:hypothetical protein